MKNKKIVLKIQNDFCGASVEEKILQGIEEGYKLAQKENINEIIENSNAIQLLAIAKLAELKLNKLSWNSSNTNQEKKQ